jgi:hypothetical protein
VTLAVTDGPPKADTASARVNAANARIRELACWSNCTAATAEDPGNAVKWSAESAKWARVAMEIESKILDIEHDQWLMHEDRKRGGS